MRVAYADPPYLGRCGAIYRHEHHGGGCWDDLATHAALIERLVADYPDGWALSLSSPSLRHLLPLCPEDVRVAAWCKSWHAIRATQAVQYAWEPVIWRGGRGGASDTPMVRDWLAVAASPKGRRRGGFEGRKPPAFTHWVLGLLGVGPEDDFIDLFSGSGAILQTARAAQGQLVWWRLS